MIVLVQRVKKADVVVEGVRTGAIGVGLLLLLGIHKDDGDGQVAWLARKCANLRIFPDDAGMMNRSLNDIGGQALVVSQFTLYGNTAKGNRPSFVDSAPPSIAKPLYESFVQQLAGHLGNPVPAGIFGADMQVSLVNDGPVTLWLERKADQSP